MSLTLETMRQRVREQVTASVAILRGANDQLDRAVARMSGSIDAAYDQGLEEAAMTAEGIDSADGVRIAAVIRAKKRLPHT